MSVTGESGCFQKFELDNKEDKVIKIYHHNKNIYDI